MPSSDISLTETGKLRVFVDCDGSFVKLQFIVGDKHIEPVIKFTRAQAMSYGTRISDTGEWPDEWPEVAIEPIPTPAFRSFGRRLREYGTNGC